MNKLGRPVHINELIVSRTLKLIILLLAIAWSLSLVAMYYYSAVNEYQRGQDSIKTKHIGMIYEKVNQPYGWYDGRYFEIKPTDKNGTVFRAIKRTPKE